MVMVSDEPWTLHWLFALALVIAFVMAYAIGANDVANAFGTSVGSGAITVNQACIFAAIFEMLGAVLMGSSVGETIRKGIVDLDCFYENEAVLMLGMTMALAGAGIWVLIATKFGLPVSTTHSIVGGVMGMGIAGGSDGFDCVMWSGFWKIVASWFTSPVCAAALSGVIFFVTHTQVMKAKQPFERAMSLMPSLFGLTAFFLSVLVVFHGPQTKNLPLLNKLGICTFVAALVFVNAMFILKPYLLSKLKGVPMPPLVVRLLGVFGVTPAVAPGNSEGLVPVTASVELRATLSDQTGDDDEAPASAEVEAKTTDAAQTTADAQEVFKYMQVFCACLKSFAHGSNDVANAIGPFAAVLSFYNSKPPEEEAVGAVPLAEAKKTSIPLWVLFGGGLGIVLGLSTWGYKVMKTIGTDLTKLNFSRGFTVEFGSALSVIMFSELGVPISSTHCQVGSVLGVGSVAGRIDKQPEGPSEAVPPQLDSNDPSTTPTSPKKSVDWKVFKNIAISWGVTVPVSCLVSAVLTIVFKRFVQHEKA